MSIEAAIKAATKGAEWLDNTVPGWEKRIDLASLELSNGCNCILGQVVVASVDPNMVYYEDFGPMLELPNKFPMNGFAFIVMEMMPYSKGGKWATEHGFQEDYNDYRYSELDEAWIMIIKSRFENGYLSDSE